MYEFYLGQKDFLHGYVFTKYGMKTRIYALDIEKFANFIKFCRGGQKLLLTNTVIRSIRNPTTLKQGAERRDSILR